MNIKQEVLYAIKSVQMRNNNSRCLCHVGKPSRHYSVPHDDAIGLRRSIRAWFSLHDSKSKSDGGNRHRKTLYDWYKSLYPNVRGYLSLRRASTDARRLLLLLRPFWWVCDLNCGVTRGWSVGVSMSNWVVTMFLYDFQKPFLCHRLLNAFAYAWN